MKIENEAIFRECLANGINLFLGAGFSIEAEGVLGPLPLGNKLRDDVIDQFKRPKPSVLNLSQICQIISSKDKKSLSEFFRNKFTVTKFDEAYKEIERANISAIFTTNIDNLIFKIFETSKKYYINDIQLRGPVIAGSSAIDYIALHGSVVYDDDNFDFSPIEISSSFERDKDKWYGFKDRIRETPTLYWGYRVEDAGVLQALSKGDTKTKKRADSWVVLHSSDAEAIEYYSSLGFQIIVGDTKKLLKYFGQLPTKKLGKIRSENKTLISKNFKEYQIPNLASVPVRSLSEFFLGAEPTWFDIFSGKLHETKHANSVRNAALGNRHVVILGGAVTGKSTLLKQLATNPIENRTALFIEEITPEKCALLVRDIDAEGQQVLALVDNAADASEAIQILMQSRNVKIIAAERDYVFDSVSHKFSAKKFELIEISALSEIDVQAVEDTIPKDVQRNHFDYASDILSIDTPPTFFEVITKTVTTNSLQSRFMDALKELKITKPAEHDLLVMACYLYACRIPVSVDIASAFLRPFGIDAPTSLKTLMSMSSLLSEYEGALAETAQSYFVPRSRAVAEVVIDKLAPLDLRRVFETFHNEVSPTKIGRYDIFRRGAYDARKIGRAFPNWKDGLKFYEHAFTRDPSHSLKQQGALYLSHKKNFELAFNWIDEARAMTGRNNPTIRNTYAVILFNANYEKMATSDVLDTLDESMRILNRCYEDDYRKLYHAKIYAEQSVKYVKKFPDSASAADYLAKSEKWLKAEIKNRPADRWLRNLLRQIQNARVAE